MAMRAFGLQATATPSLHDRADRAGPACPACTHPLSLVRG